MRLPYGLYLVHKSEVKPCRTSDTASSTDLYIASRALIQRDSEVVYEFLVMKFRWFSDMMVTVIISIKLFLSTNEQK